MRAAACLAPRARPSALRQAHFGCRPPLQSLRPLLRLQCALPHTSLLLRRRAAAQRRQCCNPAPPYELHIHRVVARRSASVAAATLRRQTRRAFSTAARGTAFAAWWFVKNIFILAARTLRALARGLASLFPALTKLIKRIPVAFLRWAEPLPRPQQALMLFLGCVCCMCLCAPILQFNLAAGALLGTQLGSCVMVASVLTGAVLNFLVARCFWQEWALQQLRDDERLESLEGAFEQNGAVVTALIRLCPAFPAGIVSYLISSTGVSLQGYIVGTVVGYVPASVFLTYIGHGLHKLRVEPSILRRFAMYGGIGTSAVSIAGLSMCGAWALVQVRERKTLERYNAQPRLDEEAREIVQQWESRDLAIGNRLL